MTPAHVPSTLCASITMKTRCDHSQLGSECHNMLIGCIESLLPPHLNTTATPTKGCRPPRFILILLCKTRISDTLSQGRCVIPAVVVLHCPAPVVAYDHVTKAVMFIHWNTAMCCTRLCAYTAINPVLLQYAHHWPVQYLVMDPILIFGPHSVFRPRLCELSLKVYLTLKPHIKDFH